MPLMSQQGNGHIFIQNTQPTPILTGDIWIDTSSSPPVEKIWDGSTFNPSASSIFPIGVS